MTSPIYLDANATTSLLPQAWEAMRRVYEQTQGNPASAHAVGRQARQFLESAREQVAALLGCKPYEVLFTSGATESNNLAIFGLASTGHLLGSMIEHPCVVEPLKQLAQRGLDVEWLPVSLEGLIDVKTVLFRLKSNTRLVTLMLANHDMGAIQPVAELAKALPKGVHLHCDAAQAVGKIPVNFRGLGATTLSASAHKFHGPTGVGLLLVKSGTTLKPLHFGGHQQRGLRPGTEPVALAVGLATALEHAIAHLETNAIRTRTLKLRFLDLLTTKVNCKVLGPDPRGERVLPGTLNVAFPGCRAELLMMALDLAGVACSTGSACSSGSLLPSPVLQAMNVGEEYLDSAIRFGFSPTITEAEVDEAVARIIPVIGTLNG
jgi:cysteine desulfurase